MVALGFDKKIAKIVLNVIDKHAFANNNNATDVGDLTVARCQTAGTQN